jgi:hypothetical protein
METYVFHYDEDRDEIKQYKLLDSNSDKYGSYYAGPFGWRYLSPEQINVSNNFFHNLEDLYKERNRLINHQIDQLMRKKVMDPKLIKNKDQV